MFITVTKWFSIAALVAAFFDRTAANRPLLEFVVFSGAVIVAVQALRVREYIWAFGFIVLALLFNPLFTIMFSGFVLRWLEVICIATFLVSLVYLRPAPLRSPLSITDLKPRRESL